MDQYTARQTLNDAALRQALWLWLEAQHPEVLYQGRPVPPPPSDETIQDELRRILLPRRKRFFGLF
jgi:hypothetical protein